ncbi:MAG: nucleoside deaminase [Chloroflexi bacterium]|nr:MAG: nucleoside deaminase [Chloroflexota bacterium]
MQEERVYRIMNDLIQFTRERALEYKTFTGTYIVKGREVIWREMTSIEKDKDPLAHAELKAIRGALAKMEGSLETCQIFTTQQPCPMCASAIVWSGIDAVYYGVPSSHQWKDDEDMKDFFSRQGVSCTGPLLEEECKEIDNYLVANRI